MAIDIYKLTTAEIAVNAVSSVAGDELTGTVQENKAVFDKLPKVIANRYNDMIDYLKSKGADDMLTPINIREVAFHLDAPPDEYVSMLTGSTLANKLDAANASIIWLKRRMDEAAIDGETVSAYTALGLSI